MIPVLGNVNVEVNVKVNVKTLLIVCHSMAGSGSGGVGCRRSGGLRSVGQR
jgi:hypothetical protein